MTHSAFTCILCGYSGEHKLVVPVLLHGKIPQEIYRCPLCRLASAKPVPSRKELEALYSGRYFQSESAYTGYADYEKSRIRQYSEGRIFTKLLKRRRQSGKMLEIGCAAGYFLEGVLSAGGWEPYGVELSSWAAEQASRIPGVTILKGTIEDAGFPENTFDVIVIRDLLEHVVNPVEFLSICRRVLKPGGKLYIKAPNGRCNLQPVIDSYRKLKKPVNLSHAHLYFFEPFNIRVLMLLCKLHVSSFYAVGLKRGIRALGWLPKVKSKDSTRLSAIELSEESPNEGEHSETEKKDTSISEPVLFKSAPEFPPSDTPLPKQYRTDTYAFFNYALKHWLRVPLALGHNYIIWAEK